ncbi:MAG TPA: dihydroneopterin aldolase [Candidatus Saccharimonadales bacterium]|nr:dihydroneopterin aldolase [Candidatus Saccharimonadales bacterium]
MDWIRLSDLSLFGHHGAHEEEMRLGQKLEFDVELGLELRGAGRSDRLEDTINYREVYGYIEARVTQKRYLLLESLAESIAEDLLARYPAVSEIVVRARKPNVPFPGALSHVEVEIHRRRA